MSLQLPWSLRKLQLDMSHQSSANAHVKCLLSKMMELSSLKELSLNLGDSHIDSATVKTFLRLAMKRDMRVLTLRERKEPTVLNAHRNQYRRKLLQAALLQRSLFQNSYCKEFLLETAELKSEIDPIEQITFQYWRDWGVDYGDWLRKRREREYEEAHQERERNDWRYTSFCPCCVDYGYYPYDFPYSYRQLEVE